jgi:hypothetical protein
MPAANPARLNPAQKKVLETLKKAGKPLPTSNKTEKGSVSGVASKALEGIGLVNITSKPKTGETLVKITSAGTKALAAT